jgi:hypothetical protein
MTALTLDPAGSPAELSARLDELDPQLRHRALRLLGVAERCCAGDVEVHHAVLDALGD